MSADSWTVILTLWREGLECFTHLIEFSCELQAPVIVTPGRDWIERNIVGTRNRLCSDYHFYSVDLIGSHLLSSPLN